jgi:hypothetical protein
VLVGIAGSGRSIIDLAGMSRGVGDELGNRPGRKRRRDKHDVRRAHDAPGRHDIADEVEAQLLIECCVDRVGGIDQEKRIAVGRCRDHRLGAEIAAGAGSVLDHGRLAKPFRQPLPHEAAGDVGAAARGERHDDPNWSRGIVERPGNTRESRRREGSCGESEELAANKFHTCLHINTKRLR